VNILLFLKNSVKKIFKSVIKNKIKTKQIKSKEDIVVEFFKKNVFNNITNEDMSVIYKKMWE
jgi:hypothetical protein